MTAKELILTHLLDCRRIDLYVDPPPLSPRQTRELETMEMRLSTGEPLQYILGRCEFMGLTLEVDERVFIPRPETEIVVEAALEKIQSLQNQRSSETPLNILDLGCGSGNIAISLARFCEACTITTIDCSKEALEVALHNAQVHRIEHKITFLKGDLWEPLKEEATEKTFDLVVSNPPYVSRREFRDLPEKVSREPILALDGGCDGLDFYLRIFKEARAFVRPGGFLILEIGDGQRRALQEMFEDHSYLRGIEFRKDLCGRDRVLVVEVAGSRRQENHGQADH